MHPCQNELSNIWFDKWKCDDAECAHQMRLAGTAKVVAPKAAVKAASPAKKAAPATSNLVSEIATARKNIRQELDRKSTSEVPSDVTARLEKLELDNADLRKTADDLRALCVALEARLSLLEGGKAAAPATAKPAAAAPAPAKAPAKKEESDDDDDCDLFGSDDDEEDEEAAKLKEERLAAYAEKKAKKPALIAKSSIVLDVKPWDDETDMVEVERLVRTIECDGLLWGASKLVPVGYGIKKLQISCVVEDDKVSTDFLEEHITGFEDHVQSMDIAAFNKI